MGLFSQRFNIQVLVWLRATTALYVIFHVSQMCNYISCCTFRTHQRRPLKHVLYYSSKHQKEFSDFVNAIDFDDIQQTD